MSNPKKATAISPTREENYPEWYQQVIIAADLAEISPVRGCMVIKPWGYAIWENIQRIMDKRFKETGHKNFYCPLFIPKSYLEKEAAHIDGFAKECAVVTHRRLEKDADGKLVPTAPLEEPLIVRPTSETIIGEMFSRWIQSYRDLPLLLNQWANIVRWEMRTRIFLRTTEFLWQEGHTAHATAEEAIAESLKMLDVYADIAHHYLAMPVIKGEKTESERFPGATSTYCIEAMMQDKKALQAGTSHFLGQNFSKAFNIKFSDDQGTEQFVWTTSWGTSTRLIGGLIMTHSDDNGLVLPPKISPIHVVIVPITQRDQDLSTLLSYCEDIAQQLRATTYDGQPLSVEIDARHHENGRGWFWYKRGVPIRLEIGNREREANNVSMNRRDQEYKARTVVSLQQFINTVTAELEDIQNTIYERALEHRQKNTVHIQSKAEFYDFFLGEQTGGFAIAFYKEDPLLEKQLKDDLGVTVRCFPLENQEIGPCIFNPSTKGQLAIFAKSY